MKEEGTGHWNSPNTGATNESGFTADGYDDVSYEVGYENGATSGDLNLDGEHNIIDIVLAVDMIINP